jgi:hypothetical protein
MYVQRFVGKIIQVRWEEKEQIMFYLNCDGNRKVLAAIGAVTNLGLF